MDIERIVIEYWPVLILLGAAMLAGILLEKARARRAFRRSNYHHSLDVNNAIGLRYPGCGSGHWIGRKLEMIAVAEFTDRSALRVWHVFWTEDTSRKNIFAKEGRWFCGHAQPTDANFVQFNAYLPADYARIVFSLLEKVVRKGTDNHIVQYE